MPISNSELLKLNSAIKIFLSLKKVYFKTTKQKYKYNKAKKFLLMCKISRKISTRKCNSK